METAKAGKIAVLVVWLTKKCLQQLLLLLLARTRATSLRWVAAIEARRLASVIDFVLRTTRTATRLLQLRATPGLAGKSGTG